MKKNYKKNAKILGMTPIIKHRLEYLRGEIEAERIAQGDFKLEIIEIK